MTQMRKPPARRSRAPDPSPGTGGDGLIVVGDDGDVVVVIEDEGIAFDTVSGDADALTVSGPGGSRTVPVPDGTDVDPAAVVAVVVVDGDGRKSQFPVVHAAGPRP